MIEIREFIDKELDTAATRVMQGDVAVPKHLAFKVAMKAAQYGAAEADPAPSEEGPVVINVSFVDIYSQLVMRFLETTPGDGSPADAIDEACLCARRVILSSITVMQELHGRVG